MLGRRNSSLSREGWYYLFVLAFVLGGAVLREVNLLILLAGLMVGPLLFSWRLSMATLRQISLKRIFPKSVAAGESFAIDVSVTNQRERLGSWALVVEDSFQGAASSAADEPTKVEVFIPFVGAQDEASARYRCSIPSRGRYQFRPMTISTRFPFGFTRASIQIGVDDSILVCPKLGQLMPEWNRLLDSQIAGDQHSRPRRGTSQGDYFGLREWRAGDSRRWIHWRTTAKRGSVAVLEFEHQRNMHILLLLDLWQPAEPDAQQQQAVETAISLAATAVVNLCRQGENKLRIAAFGNQANTWSATTSRIFCQEVLEQLATVHGGESTPFVQNFAPLQERATDHARPIVISTRPEHPAFVRELNKVLERDGKIDSRIEWVNVTSSDLGRFFHV